jgi:predicted permease
MRYWQELATACYALSKAKGYAATVVLTLGLTLGTLVAMFNLNYQMLAAPLPYADEDTLVAGSASWLSAGGEMILPHALPKVIHHFYAKPSPLLQELALLGYALSEATLRDLPHSPAVHVAYTTAGYMRMFQLPLVSGRAFASTEEPGQHHAVAVISERLWREQYQAAPDMIGRQVQLGTISFKVIGIAAASFVEPQLLSPALHTDIWLPWDFHTDFVEMPDSGIRAGHFYLAQLKHSADRQQFEQEIRPQLQPLWQQASSHIPRLAGRQLQFNAHPLRQVLLGDGRQQSLWLLAGSAALLLLAAVNMLNLLLSRAASQQKTMAIQAALGAQRAQTMSLFKAELTCLLLAAGGVALLTAAGVFQLLRLYAGDMLPGIRQLDFDGLTLAVAVLLGGLLLVTFTQLVSRRLNYRALQQSLQSGSKGVGLTVSPTTRFILISTQVMLTSLILLCCSQVFSAAYLQLQQQLGFAVADRYQITLEDISPPPAPDLSAAALQAYHRQQKDQLMQIRDLMMQLPDVTMAAVSSGSPASYNGFSADTANFIPTTDVSAPAIEAKVMHTDQYLMPLFEIPLLQGRQFSAAEVQTQAPLIIINQTLALKLKPGQDVIGQRITAAQSGQVFEIIGVSADQNLPEIGADNEPFRIYTTQNLLYSSYLLVQTKPGAQINKATMNQLIAKVAPNIRSANIYNIANNVSTALQLQQLSAAVTSGLGILSLLLAAIGIYGVLHYSVQLRRFELGVRMAIGARPATIVSQFMLEISVPTLTGLGLALLLLNAGQAKYQFFTGSLLPSALLPILMILLLTLLTTLASVWHVIRKPAMHALQGR